MDFRRMSVQEEMVADFLKKLGFRFSYEVVSLMIPVRYEGNGGKVYQRVFTPDFYLEDFGLFVEVVGGDRSFNYDKNDVFKSVGLRVLWLNVGRDGWRENFKEYFCCFVRRREKVFRSLKF